MIKIKNARQNNLKNISLEIPKNQLIVITGVSGSGKSSLAFDIINKEGQRLFLSSQLAQARKYLGKLKKAKVDFIEGLTPCISIAQNNKNNNPRSTVGTLTEIYDGLRLLFARAGSLQKNTSNINRSSFSFNSKNGACPNCLGLGIEDTISVNLLISDENKSIREGCFKIVNPDGYIIYSQVRMEELEKVCQANNFSVDTAWNKLNNEQKNIVLNGDNKIKILYGKHSLESRMKWSGMKANPREKEFYKGILPVMNEILRRDRNPNILRFAKTQTCSLCNGSRLKEESTSIKILGKNIFEFSQLSISQLKAEITLEKFSKTEQQNLFPIINNIQKQIENLELLGLGYLSLDRNTNQLSVGEQQSIRLASLINSKLNNITYIFDEPSVGLHPSRNKNVIKILKKIVAQGNTVFVVEHDAETIRNADWIIEIGPKAGRNGGELLFNGSQKDFFSKEYSSLTKDFLTGEKEISLKTKNKTVPSEVFSIKNVSINNLKNINVQIKKQAFNVVTGVSGAGKSSLILQTLIPLIKQEYNKQINAKGEPSISNYSFNKMFFVNQAAIGKTARSTPATYIKLFDLIRDFYSKLPESKKANLKKTHFSFNTKGGRCDTCEGAGKIEIGMHLLGNVESTCSTCNGKRFKENILKIKYNNKNISEVLEMTVDEAIEFFNTEKKIIKYLEVLSKIGLAYIQLGQSSNTLSGGEAQRIRLASELVKERTSNQLFIFDEPSTGLHFADIQTLLNIFSELIDKGNTIIVIEHNEDIIKNSEHIIDLGPSSAKQGGEVIYEGNYNNFINCKTSFTATSLSQIEYIPSPKKAENKYIELNGVNTHNLKNISIKIPYNKHTVVTGKSGSGKSSLVFDTIFAEAQNTFAESFPSYIQQFSRIQTQSDVESIKGLLPSIALKQDIQIKDRRSTIGTLTNISENLRLLFSRFGISYCPNCNSKIKQNSCDKCKLEFIDTNKAANYSFNQSEGACNKCKGLGEVLSTKPELLIGNTNLPLSNGAIKRSKLLESYVDRNEKYMSTLIEVGKQKGIDYTLAFKDLSTEAIKIAFYGTGEEIFDVEWTYKTKTDTGKHRFSGKWIGFEGLLLDEYYRRQANGKGSELMPFLEFKTCHTCNGQKLKPEILNVRFYSKNIYDLSSMPFDKLLNFFISIPKSSLTNQITENIIEQIKNLIQFNLSYLNLDRKSNTLSGGELQRISLSTQLKGGLTGLCYILDEPSSGLHPHDVKSIIHNIKNLVEKGNTVITVEHQKDIIQSADKLILLGPNAGKNGGEIIKEKYKKEDIGCIKNKNNTNSFFGFRNAQIHKLKNIDISFKTHTFNVFTGISGSGKTTLMRDVMFKSHKQNTNCSETFGLSDFNNIIWIDRHSMSKSTISSLVSYLGLLDDIKKAFSPILKGSNIKIAQLSYNNKQGQCSDCKGHGFIETKLDFLSDVQNTCETCNGTRYKPEILEIKLMHKNISEILDMSINEAALFFKNNKAISRKLETLKTLGLSYLKLGQNSHEFSGGEAQRISIAKTLILNNTDQNLYIFDEASRGLHLSDLNFLIQMFNELLSAGHTIIAIEHNPDIIKRAEYIIDIHNGNITYQGELKQIRGTLIEKHLN